MVGREGAQDPAQRRGSLALEDTWHTWQEQRSVAREEEAGPGVEAGDTGLGSPSLGWMSFALRSLSS